jgi:hypothetical protein
MRYTLRILCAFGLLVLVAYGANPKPASPRPDDHNPVVIVFKDGHKQSIDSEDLGQITLNAPAMIVFKDGHRQKISAADIVRIEFGTTTGASGVSRNHFLGKWEVGDGNGSTFLITLEPNGSATKSIGAKHGTWTVVGNEARISWDDGWHDAIRKVGSKHEKFAYEPSKSFDDSPSNVTSARNTHPEPI